METINSISKYIENDWYGRLYLAVTTFDTSETPRRSMTGNIEYELCTMV